MATRDYSSHPDAMRPLPFPALPGCSVYFSFSAAKNLQTAVGITSAATIMQRLLTGDIAVIEEAAARGILNGDGTSWSAGIDAIPMPLMPLGKALADALHRRIFGEALEVEGADE